MNKSIKLFVPLVPLVLLSACDSNSNSNSNGSQVTGAASSAFTAKDALYPDQWHLNNTGDAPSSWGSYKKLTANADLRVKEVWDKGITGKDIVVTVFDDGLDFQHPDLKEQEMLGMSFNYADGTSNVTPEYPSSGSADLIDHGTGCAGLIAAKADNGGVVGIAPSAKLAGIRMLGITPTAETQLINPYTKVREMDASQVSNHSYGPNDDGKLYAQDQETYDSIQALVTGTNNGEGHVMVFAAGNGRTYVPKDYKPSEIRQGYADYDSDYTVSKQLGDYAGLDMSQQHPYILSVSGFDANDTEVSYAEAGPATLVAGATGDTVLGAIASEINSGKQLGYLIVNDPESTVAANMATTGRNAFEYSKRERYDSVRVNGTAEPAGFNFAFNGTSAAAPTVTGVSALVRSANQDLSWRDVRWILAKTARKIRLGKNVINEALSKESTGELSKPLWSTSGNSEFGQYSHYFGYGAVNAAAAVELGSSTSYKKLPEMQTCTLPVNDANKAFVSNESCPGTIEFVQVKYTAKVNANINDQLLTMTLADDQGKVIDLIAPSTCTAEDGCGLTADTTVRGGTVGFMGDKLNAGEAAGFSFNMVENGSTSDAITVSEVTVYGFNL